MLSRISLLLTPLFGECAFVMASRDAVRRHLNVDEVHAAVADAVFPLVVSGGCTARLVIEQVAEVCDCLAEPFLSALLGLDMEPQEETDYAALHHKLGQLCAAAWGTVETSTWQDIDKRFTDPFMTHFFRGGTYLNSETGNLKEDPVEKYPTSVASRATAENVDEFYSGRSFETSVLQGFGSNTVLAAESRKENNGDVCPNSQAILCCWGRDRQSNDNNGNCRPNDCEDAEPADNSNLCMTENEGDIHCHGLAWSSDPNHISTIFKFNTLFYVSLYDHWYTRGYVQNSLDGNIVDKTGNNPPMCGCADQMPAVTRADCTEVASADIQFSIDWNEDSSQGLSIIGGPLTDMQVQECRGHLFGNPNRDENNDLASYMNALVANGQMSPLTQARNFETLVGFGQPNNNNNEEACALGTARLHMMQSERTMRMSFLFSVSTGKRGRIGLVMVSLFLCLGVFAGTVLITKWQNVSQATAKEDSSVDDGDEEESSSFSFHE